MAKCFTQKAEYRVPKTDFLTFPQQVWQAPSLESHCLGSNLSLTGCGILGKLLNFSVPQFLTYKMGVILPTSRVVTRIKTGDSYKVLRISIGMYKHIMYLLLSALKVKLTEKVATSPLFLELCIQHPPLVVLSPPPRREVLWDVSHRAVQATRAWPKIRTFHLHRIVQVSILPKLFCRANAFSC